MSVVEIERDAGVMVIRMNRPERMNALGMEMRGGTPAEMDKRMKDDIVKWGVVIEKAGIEKRLGELIAADRARRLRIQSLLRVSRANTTGSIYAWRIAGSGQ